MAMDLVPHLTHFMPTLYESPIASSLSSIVSARSTLSLNLPFDDWLVVPCGSAFDFRVPVCPPSGSLHAKMINGRSWPRFIFAHFNIHSQDGAALFWGMPHETDIGSYEIGLYAEDDYLLKQVTLVVSMKN
jgi:hypothetical protein